MSSVNNIKAVDRLIKDIMKNNSFFGNKIVVFCGDPRQTLPIVRRGNRAAIVACSLQKCSDIWNNAKKIKLNINMRVIKMVILKMQEILQNFLSMLVKILRT